MYKLQQKDLNKAAQVLAHAFKDDELYVYLVPNEKKREIFLKDFFKFRVNYAFAKGEIYAIDEDINCVMAYNFPNSHMTVKDIINFGAASAILKHGLILAKNILKFNSYMENVEKSFNISDTYSLGPLGVSPNMQGKGYGKKLFQHITHNVIGKEKLQILHTQNESNCTLYSKFGFKLISKVDVPNTNLTSFSMVNLDI